MGVGRSSVVTVPGDASREDFDAYVAARRTALVRSAVLMGCSPHDAEDLVQVTLSRCLPRWGRIASDRPGRLRLPRPAQLVPRQPTPSLDR